MMKMEMMGMTQQVNHIFLEVCILQILIRKCQCVLIFLYLNTACSVPCKVCSEDFLIIGAKSKDAENKRYTGMF